MSKATESELARLHAEVARVLTRRLKVGIMGKDDLPLSGTEGLGCSAADIAAAIAFLKNNNITADPETNTGLDDLRKQLEGMRRQGKEGLRATREEVGLQIDRDLGLPN